MVTMYLGKTAQELREAIEKAEIYSEFEETPSFHLILLKAKLEKKVVERSVIECEINNLKRQIAEKQVKTEAYAMEASNIGKKDPLPLPPVKEQDQ